MDIDLFIKELRERFRPYGRLNVASTGPRVDSVWFIEDSPSGVSVHIRDLEKMTASVIIDIPLHLSLDYTLGTTTLDVMQKASQIYASLPQVLNRINEYADLIFDAHKTVKAHRV